MLSYVNLKKKKNSSKRIAIFYFKGPGQNALTASGMEVVPSLYNLLVRLKNEGYFTVDKGSVTVNGVSLTVCNPTRDSFKVCIIPYTFEHTNFHNIKVGSKVNLEFDILGKYISRMNELTK